MNKILTFSFVIILFSCGNYCENKLKPMKIKGIITNKYIDERNHATKMITIKEGNFEYNIFYFENYSKNFWDFTSIEDSICKEKNSLSIQIIREREAVNFDFNCEF